MSGHSSHTDLMKGQDESLTISAKGKYSLNPGRWVGALCSPERKGGLLAQTEWLLNSPQSASSSAPLMVCLRAPRVQMFLCLYV